MGISAAATEHRCRTIYFGVMADYQLFNRERGAQIAGCELFTAGLQVDSWDSTPLKSS
jgi:hypothetical protein